ncbi:MAG: hypothetical protein ACRCZZ_10555 [Phocaeicola sp.]
MRRFACHKLFLTPQLTFPQSVVEVVDGGVFNDSFLLKEEMQGTEWVGGVIFLSSQRELESLSPEEAWDAFLSCTDPQPVEKCLVWHLSSFDFSQNRATPQSRLKRLY